MQVKMYCEDKTLVPTQAHPGEDAGWDLKTPEDFVIYPDSTRVCVLDLKLDIPKGYEVVIRGRSGLSFKEGIRIFQTGTIDCGYRGNIGVHLENTTGRRRTFKKGDKIAQMVFHKVPEVEPIFVDSEEELNDSKRGDGGFGSSD